MTTQPKKAGRKSNAEKAAEAAAQAATQELAKIEVIEGEKVMTDLEPVSEIDPEAEIKADLEAPVIDSVDPIGEDLGDVTNQAPETPVIASDEASEPVPVSEIDLAAELEQSIQDEIDSEAVADIIAQASFTPILVPTMVGDERKGHIPCPKAVFELVQIEGWQETIEEHPVHVQNGLKSVMYWQEINGDVKVRCQSSSKFAEAK